MSGIADADIHHAGAERRVLVGDMGIEQPSARYRTSGWRCLCSRPATRAWKRWPSEDEVVPSRPSGRQGVAILVVDQLGQGRRIGFVADVPACSRQLGVGQAGLDSAILVSLRLIASPRIADSSNVLSLASAPSFKWVKWLKPVQSSTSISSSVILMRGSNWLVWSISACARSAPPHPAG